MAMAVAELTLFGGFGIRLASGRAAELPVRKDRALLAVLALPPGATHSRESLASLLWSDRGDQQARDSLRHSLTRLRQCLQGATPPPIVADRQSVRLDPAAVTTDVAAFERLLTEGTPEALQRAAALYLGDLLDGIGVRDPAFEDWLLIERQRLRQLADEALAKLLAQSMMAGARDRAAAAARQMLTLDPLREAAFRALMQIHTERGQTTQALKLYESLRDRLHRELGVKPEPATVQLYHSIRERRVVPVPPAGDQIPVGESARPTLSLPDKPSIAVLPFRNMSGEPEQEYFADGMVDDIITALSRFRNLFVIARDSSFAYKDRAVDIKQVGRELGVRYVLEGSVRKAADRLRITGQLIDASTGAHLWADHFDGALSEVFQLQDQVAASVVGAITPRLEEAEIERAKRKPTEDLDAYDHYLRGLAMIDRVTNEGISKALQLFSKAIEQDPDFALAYARAAFCYAYRRVNGWMLDRARETAEAARLARRAVYLGRDDAVALCYGGLVLGYVAGELDDGAAFVDRALALNANLAAAWGFSGWMKICLGDFETGLKHVAMAMRLSPLDSRIFAWQYYTGLAHFCAGSYDDATLWSEEALRSQPNNANAMRTLAASHALAGRIAEAEKAMARLRQFDPELRVSKLEEVMPPFRRPEDRSRYLEGLRKAGLPE